MQLFIGNITSKFFHYLCGTFWSNFCFNKFCVKFFCTWSILCIGTSGMEFSSIIDLYISPVFKLRAVFDFTLHEGTASHVNEFFCNRSVLVSGSNSFSYILCKWGFKFLFKTSDLFKLGLIRWFIFKSSSKRLVYFKKVFEVKSTSFS